MKMINQLLAVLVASVLIGTLAINQVYAPRSCGSCVQFKKLTHEFERNVIKLIRDESSGPQPHLRELLDAYSQNVQRIFIGDPNLDQVKTLLESYEHDVTRIFDINPPDPDRQQQHAQIKEFRQLTNALATEVLVLAHEGFNDQ